MAQSLSIQPKKKWISKDGLKYQFTDRTQYIVANRAPTINDYENFQLGAIWLNKNVTPIANREVWTLVGKDNLIATWVLMDTGGTVLPDIETLSGDVGINPVGPDINHNINIFGNTGGNESIFDLNFRNIRVRGDAANNTLEVHLNNSINLPLTNTAGTQGLYGLGGVRFMHNYDPQNFSTYVGSAAGNLTNTASENVGVGLNALGSVTTGQFNVAVGSGAASLLLDGENNVGIGRQALLSVTDGSRNIAVGTQALGVNQLGIDNIAIGFQSLVSATGDFNIAIGSVAGHDITTGINNVLIGVDSGTDIDVGTDNIGIGRQTLFSTITGARNIAVGTQALAANVIGNDNISIGYQTLLTASGDNNIAIGSQAGENLLTGTNNILIGSDTGSDITSGTDNIGLGHGNLLSLTTGQFNIAIGNGALNTITSTGNPPTSNPSIAIGHEALEASTNGDNIAIGYQAGQSITTGEFHVLIGNFAGTSITSGDNCIAIGSGALGDNQTGDRNIAIGTGASDAVTIGTDNISIGFEALTNLTTGLRNIAIGRHALRDNQSANNQIAIGDQALLVCTYNDVQGNIAIGEDCMVQATTGFANTIIGTIAADDGVITGESNTGVGYSCLTRLSSGSFNTVLGRDAGNEITTGEHNIVIDTISTQFPDTGSSNILIGATSLLGAESNTIRIGRSGSGTGQQDRNFQVGIRGVTTGVADAIAVLIDSANQLGTISSSIRYKENIKDIDNESAAIYNLRPVVFNYKNDKDKNKQYGLIAEEVEEHIPFMVAYDDEGEPMALHDRFLPFMILNELQKLKIEIEKLKKKLK